jgi:hypothetical protein
VLRGELTGLRALTDADIEIFETELLTDVETRIRASRDVAWIDGGFADGVTLSQLAGEWSRPAP